MFESIIAYNGITVFWGDHLEFHTCIKMDIDTIPQQNLEWMMLDHFINTCGAAGYNFLVLVNGVPVDWNLYGVV